MSRTIRRTSGLEEFRTRKEQNKRRQSPRSIGRRDPSLRWPHLYDILVAKGYSKEKAARISNSRRHLRKKGRLVVKKGAKFSVEEFACYSKACAPPPAGTGGSKGGGPSGSVAGKIKAIQAEIAGNDLTRFQMPQIPGPRVNQFLAHLDAEGVSVKRRSVDPNTLKATQNEIGPAEVLRSMSGLKSGAHKKPSLVSNDGAVIDGHHTWAAARVLGRKADVLVVDLPKKQLLAEANKFAHQVGTQNIRAELAAELAEELACHSKACAPPPVGTGGSKGGAGGSGSISSKNSKKLFKAIGSDGARGDSIPVSYMEFQSYARRGQDQLDALTGSPTGTKGLDDNWDRIKADSHAEAMKEWGGATIDPVTGDALPQGVDKYALTVKGEGLSTVSVPEGSDRATFDKAMDDAREQFGEALKNKDHYLGVFHDDDLGRIDIDPVLVVGSKEEVRTIGAATYAIGGAYHFESGDGFWPPHVVPGGWRG